VCLAVIFARFVWVFPATYIPRRLNRRLRERDPSPPWQSVTVISYAGMRGAVSLAAALAIPFTPESGAPFPGRDLVIFLTFCVIFVTLVGQWLTLQPLIRWLDIHDDGSSEKEEIKARLLAAEAALQRIDELADEGWVNEDTVERMRGMYGYRRRRFATRHASVNDKRVSDFAADLGDGSDDEDYEAGALGELPASQARASGVRARSRAALEERGQDWGRGHAPARARPRPRRLEARDINSVAGQEPSALC
jgi:hypothetical protein